MLYRPFTQRKILLLRKVEYHNIFVYQVQVVVNLTKNLSHSIVFTVMYRELGVV